TRWFGRRASGKRRAGPERFQPPLERPEGRTTPAIVTPFTVRFTTNDVGDTVILGNTLETASTVINNNDGNMVYVDVDNNPATFNRFCLARRAQADPPGSAPWGAQLRPLPRL